MNWRRLRLKTDNGADSEDQLICGAKAGDRSAFDALRRLHEQPLMRFIWRRAGTQMAEDIAQETWLGAWQAINTWNGRARFKVWLFSIAEHKCADHHRANARHSHVDYSDEWERHADNSAEAYAAAELRDTVQALLGNLPEPQREILELYYYDELTLPEIAAMLKRNLNTVKYQFYRGHTLVGSGLAAQEPRYADTAARQGGKKR